MNVACDYEAPMQMLTTEKLVVVVLRSPIHANELSEYKGMLYRTSNRVLNNGIKVIILICMDGTSQYHHHRKIYSDPGNGPRPRLEMVRRRSSQVKIWVALLNGP